MEGDDKTRQAKTSQEFRNLESARSTVPEVPYKTMRYWALSPVSTKSFGGYGKIAFLESKSGNASTLVGDAFFGNFVSRLSPCSEKSILTYP